MTPHSRWLRGDAAVSGDPRSRASHGLPDLPVFIARPDLVSMVPMAQPVLRELIHPHSNWRAFLPSATVAGAAGFLLPGSDAMGWDRLRRFQRVRPALPVLVVTEHCRQLALRLASADPIAAIVFVDDAPRALVPALRSLRRVSRLAIAAAWFRREVADRELGETLARACVGAQPPRRVQQLSALMGYDRSTFCRRWNRWQAGSGVTPHWFIDWLLVARALDFRRHGSATWAAAAGGAGATEATLRQAGARLFQRPLGWIERRPGDWLVERLQHTLGHPRSARPTQQV